MHHPQSAVSDALRTSYGKLIAIIAAKTGDVEGAEDALSDAVESALAQWPHDGIPENPTAWLLTVARRRYIDEARRATTMQRRHADVVNYVSEWIAPSSRDAEIADKRLSLMFACAHPAIAPTVRTALMLQCILGLSAERIASAFLTSPATMSQRLVRAKTKIRATGLALDVPHPRYLPARLPFVVDAIYAAYTTASDDLDEEAIELARIMLGSMPEAHAVRGLLALMLVSHARRSTRSPVDGLFVPLNEQDARTWDRAMINEGASLTHELFTIGYRDRFVVEAAIQLEHSGRAFGRNPSWTSIVALYDELLLHTTAVGAHVARAVALCEAGSPHDALAALDACSQERVLTYQPYWAARAHVLQQLDRPDDARTCRTKAIGLTQDASVRAYLLAQQ